MWGFAFAAKNERGDKSFEICFSTREKYIKKNLTCVLEHIARLGPFLVFAIERVWRFANEIASCNFVTKKCEEQTSRKKVHHQGKLKRRKHCSSEFARVRIGK